MSTLCVVNDQEDDRLKRLDQTMERRKSKGNRLCWIRWNPNSDYGYDIEDADEDVRWMIFEIKRLRDDNRLLQDFVDTYRKDMESELEDKV